LNEHPTLAVAAICQNEERDLPGFLENLLPWVDEVILVDDCSTDQTVPIARRAGPKVKIIQRKMQPETGYAGQRNVAIEAAESDWLLHMDIDERVTPELAREIRASISRPDVNGYRYRRLNYFLHRPMGWGGLQFWNNVQLACRGKHHFENQIHEVCFVEGEIGQLTGLMWHLNDESYAERIRKSLNYSQIEADKLLRQGKKIRANHLVFRPLILFFKSYILRHGYRDGVPGLIFALHSANAVFRALALAWDKQNLIDRISLEKEIMARWQNYEVEV
jgi:(heptosyl)LPS beta-1,4-glucosyltransferase